MTPTDPQATLTPESRFAGDAPEAGDIVFTAADIANAVNEIAARVRQDYRGEPILLAGVLKGAALFTADLMRALGDYPVMIDFMVVASYGVGRFDGAAGNVRILKDLDVNPAGHNVLLVEDIVDEGLTLQYLLNNLRSRAPKSLRACALIDKAFHRKTDVVVDYVGLHAPDAFLVGYGLDHQERFRNLPHICKLRAAV